MTVLKSLGIFFFKKKNLITIQKVLLLCLQKGAKKSRLKPGKGKFRYTVEMSAK